MSLRIFSGLILLIGAIALPGFSHGLQYSTTAISDEPKRVTLGDMLGNQVTLSATRGKMPTVLVFYRGYWCPFCARQLSEPRSLLKTNERCACSW